MTSSFKKIFPLEVKKNNSEIFSLFFLSEGFLENEQSVYFNACAEFISRLGSYYPLSLLNMPSSNLQIFGHFSPSNFSGSAKEKSSIQGRTVLESYLREDGVIEIEPERVIEHIKSISINHREKMLFDYIIGEALSASRTLLVVLVQNSNTDSFGGEGLIQLKNLNNTLCAVTTISGFWEQVIIRALCQLFQLGDEYELEHDDNLAPHGGSKVVNLRYNNLVYMEEIPQAIKLGDLRWRKLSGMESQEKELNLHRHPSHPNLADLTIPDFSYSPERIELWEGGGGYRTKVYRSAYDCLTRRKIGDERLPLRHAKLPLCKACESYLLKLIFSNVGFRSGIIKPE